MTFAKVLVMKEFQLQKSRKERAAATRWRRSYSVSRPASEQLDTVGPPP
jgi:hypothetical protein